MPSWESLYCIVFIDAFSFADELPPCSAARKWPGKHRTQGYGDQQGATARGRCIQGQFDREPIGQFPNHSARDFRNDQKAVRFSFLSEYPWLFKRSLTRSQCSQLPQRGRRGADVCRLATRPVGPNLAHYLPTELSHLHNRLLDNVHQRVQSSEEDVAIHECFPTPLRIPISFLPSVYLRVLFSR